MLDEDQIQIHQSRDEQMHIQPCYLRVGHDGGDGEGHLSDELAVLTDGLCSLHDALVDEEPRDKAHQHEQKAPELDLAAVQHHGDVAALSQSDIKGEPVYEQGEQGLDDRPQRADDRALVFFDQLVFSQQHDLLAETVMFLIDLEQINQPPYDRKMVIRIRIIPVCQRLFGAQ